MAGRRISADTRNSLPWAFLDFVDRIKPKSVVMENVLGINRAFKNVSTDGSTLRQLELALASRGDGYMVQPIEVNARHFGVPQNRPRMMLIAVRLDALPGNAEDKESRVWRSADAWARLANGEDPAQGLALVPQVGSRVPDGTGLLSRREFSIIEAIADLGESNYRWAVDDPRYNHEHLDYARFMRGALPDHVFNHQRRRHGEVVKQRFALYHFLARHNASAKVMNLAAAATQLTEARIAVRQALGSLATVNVVGESFAADGDAELVDSVVRLSTAKHSQRVALGHHPSPTVLTLPDDLVHPRKNRIMTVRELARIQSFPDWYEFRSKVTTGGVSRRFEVPQYSQVGNAIPPLMAQAIAECLIRVLRPQSPHALVH
jgi:DNA (cytosine-5)-methyltransferase 1